MGIDIDKRKARDYAFKAVIVALFMGLVYISVSSPGEKPEIGGTDTMNADLPDGNAEPLLDKMRAYESEPVIRGEERRMRTLNDYAFSLKGGEGAFPAAGTDTLPSPPVENPGIEALRHSIQRQDTPDEIEREYERIQADREELRRELAMAREELGRKGGAEEQAAMLERSYELAARYTGKAPVGEVPPPAPEERDRETVEVTRLGKDVVSTLSEELLLENPYNFGFNTAIGSGYQASANTIRAAVSGDQTITVGDRVTLRLLEPLQAGNTIIPRNHLIAGVSRVQGDRMDIMIESMEYAGNIIPVSLRVYDTDGLPGIHCPGSAELDALKEGAANIGSGLGTSVSFTHSAGQQVAMDLARGVMGGASQYISKKMRTVRINLRSNYEVLLLPKKN